MTKRTIEIDDNLEELKETIIEEMKDDFLDFVEQNLDITEFDTYYQNSGCDKASESADSNTPIYNADIDGLYFLHGDELDESYNNAGIGDGTEHNHRAVTIYCYLNEKAHDTLRDLNEVFDEWYSLEDTEKTFEKLKELVGEM